MALWQYTFHILPKESVETLLDSHPLSISDDGFDDSVYWEFKPVRRDVFKKIGQILPETRSWCSDIDQYGSLESNCFEVLHENERVLSASFRIDYTTNYEPLLRLLIEFLVLHDMALLDEEFNVLHMNVETIHQVIGHSQQVKTYQRFLEGK